MIIADFKDVDEMQRHLKVFAPKGIPYAVKFALNQTAWHGRKTMQRLISARMIEKNKWTRQSIRVNTVRSMDVDMMFSEMGSIEKYMVKQEVGGIAKGKPGRAYPIATSYAAGQSGRRTRLPRKPNRVGKIRLRFRKPKGRTKGEQNKALIMAAAEARDKFIYLDLKRGRGVFRLLGGKRKPRLKMVADLSRKRVRVPKTPTLEPAAEHAIDKMPEFFRDAFIFQLRRHRLIKD